MLKRRNLRNNAYLIIGFQLLIELARPAGQGVYFLRLSDGGSQQLAGLSDSNRHEKHYLLPFQKKVTYKHPSLNLPRRLI